jgi:hypothetical protein
VSFNAIARAKVNAAANGKINPVVKKRRAATGPGVTIAAKP